MKVTQWPAQHKFPQTRDTKVSLPIESGTNADNSVINPVIVKGVKVPQCPWLCCLSVSILNESDGGGDAEIIL